MNALHECRVTSLEPRKIYSGLAEEKWEESYYNHKVSLNHKLYLHEAALSSYI